MEVYYNMFDQNHVHYNYVFQKITLWGGGAMVKDLNSQFGGEDVTKREGRELERVLCRNIETNRHGERTDPNRI